MQTPEDSLFLSRLREIPGLNPDYALGNLGVSPELYGKIMEKTLRMLPARLAEMDAALEAGALSAFGHKAHGMKGAFGQLGAQALSALAGELERAGKQEDGAACHARYAAYREAALALHGRAEAVLREAAGPGKAEATRPPGRIADFTKTLAEAVSAASAFDAAEALARLAPLMDYRFEEEIARPLARAAEELDAFRPKGALPYLKLLEAAARG